MKNMDKLLKMAAENNASDIHLICGLKPILRITRELHTIEEFDILTEQDIYEIYDYLIRGNLEKDETFKTTRKLDTSYELDNLRFRVNMSYANDIPTFTLRLIQRELPLFSELGVPDVVRRMTRQQQGLILVTGKTNSGKTTTLNALINDINEKKNKKILTLESPVEYRHTSKKSISINWFEF